MVWSFFPKWYAESPQGISEGEMEDGLVVFRQVVRKVHVFYFHWANELDIYQASTKFFSQNCVVNLTIDQPFSMYFFPFFLE